jgi:two-component system sensor kinase FixL
VLVEACLREAVELNPLPQAIEVDWDLPAETLAMYCDQAQLQIVFGNLIRNARDAMPEGGVLRLHASRDRDAASIVVRDSGFGIAPDVLPYIFEPLYSTKAKGIGLGLSISRDIIARHNGTIAVSSEPHMGTTVTLRLPAAPEP